MRQAWSDFTIVDVRPPVVTYSRLVDSAFRVVYMWAAGPEWVVATPDRVTREPVMFESEDPSVAPQFRPYTDEDQAEEDDWLDEVLVGLDLPPRPRGLDWYLRMHRNAGAELGHRVDSRLRAAIPNGYDGLTTASEVEVTMANIVREELQASLLRDVR